LINRTSLNNIEKILTENNTWKVLEIGCGYTANKHSDVICDILDLSEFYKGRKFIKLVDKKLPFSNKEFDFVIASHVLEHVKDVEFLIQELQRVSSKGYIEVPTKLEDNLVFENKKEHLWHMDFDDDNYKLIISKKIQYIEPVVTVSTIKKLNKFFRKSFVLELYWENNIDYNLDNSENIKEEKISLTSLFRKFFSKKIRTLVK